MRNVSGTTNAILKDINIHRFIYYCLSRKTSRNVSNQAWFHDPFQFLQRPLQYLFGTPSETLRLRWCESLPYKLCMDWSTCHLCLPQSTRAGPGWARPSWTGPGQSGPGWKMLSTQLGLLAGMMKWCTPVSTESYNGESGDLMEAVKEGKRAVCPANESEKGGGGTEQRGSPQSRRCVKVCQISTLTINVLGRISPLNGSVF